MKIVAVFDDTSKKSELIEDIIGEKGFADVVVKNNRLEEYYHNHVRAVYPEAIWYKTHAIFEYTEIIRDIDKITDTDIKIIHCFSNFFIADASKATLAFRKLQYIDEVLGIKCGKKVAGAMFPNLKEYALFCKNLGNATSATNLISNFKDGFEVEGLVDISDISNFIQCITGNFEARYFNSLKGNQYVIEKTSRNKEKIKAEYNFYHLLPEDMKYWFVMPFNYIEDDEKASYTMERLHMTDLAIKWVHGSMDANEFEGILDKYFYFLSCRHKKTCSTEEYRHISDELYVQKLKQRIAMLKSRTEYEKICKLLDATGITIDSLAQQYFNLKDKIEGEVAFIPELVIGHGDPCFANTLYNRATKTLKFIDPKGANCEEELWTNAYYDVAKISHSVCGLYDFFNNGLYDIKIDNNFCYDLYIPFDNSKYVEIFKKKVQENGYDYRAIRLYEASLFLSMLPLHIDNPYKVFGFILNARNILKELESYV